MHVPTFDVHGQHLWPLLKAGGGSGPGRDFAVVANLSARVGSIGDNRIGGWHSYRASKASLNQRIDCYPSFVYSFIFFFSFWLKFICGTSSPKFCFHYMTCE